MSHKFNSTIACSRLAKYAAQKPGSALIATKEAHCEADRQHEMRQQTGVQTEGPEWATLFTGTRELQRAASAGFRQIWRQPKNLRWWTLPSFINSD